MENPLHRTRSLTRQKWDSTVQKWDSALGKANRSGAIFSRHPSANDRMRSFNSGELRTDNRSRAFLSGELPLARPPTDRGRSKAFHSGELRVVHLPYENGKPRAFLSGELPLTRPPAGAVPASKHCESSRCTGRGFYSSGGSSRPVANVTSAEEESGKRAGLLSGARYEGNSQSQAALYPELLAGEQGQQTDTELRCFSAGLDSYSNADAATISNIQTETEGSRSRLLSTRGESSSFRGKQLSSSLSDSPSFRKETVSSSFRSESSSRRKDRKASKSSQDGIGSRFASESTAPPLHHIYEAGYSRKSTVSCESIRASIPSSPDTCAGKSSVPFQWEETPGKAKTIAAAAEMALARKLVRDESIRRINAASPRASVDGHSSRLSEKVASSHSSRFLSSDLPLPPSKKGSQEFSVPRKDPHSSQLIEKLKAAVVKKQAEGQVSRVKDDDTRSEMSDFGEQAHIDLVAPAAAKIFNREDDFPVLTPMKTPLAVPFKWEEAPGKPKDCGASPPAPEPPFLTLPPRLLGGCHNPSKEQQAKILESYSGILMDMQWSASGNPTPLSRSRDATPTRKERTPTRRDRTPSKKDVNSGRRDTTPGRRDITPGRRDINPASRDSTPTRRSYFPARIVSNSGPLSFPSVRSSESVRDHHSGPLRINSLPDIGPLPSSRPAGFPPLDSRLLENFGDQLSAPLRRSNIPKSGPLMSGRLDQPALEEASNRRRETVRSNTFPKNFNNAIPRRASLDFPCARSESSLVNTTGEFDSSCRALSISGPGYQDNKQTSWMASQDLQIARCDSASEFAGMSCAGSDSGEVRKQPSMALVKADPLSPTSILCDPTVSSQRSPSNLSSAYAESSHSHHSLKSVSRHSQSDSCTSLESFVDEAYDVPIPWTDGPALESSLSLGLGPIENSGEAAQGNKLLEDSVKAILNFCRKAKNWSKLRTTERKNSAEPDMWAPTLATYFQKLELGGTFLSKVGSQVFPESRDLKVSHTPVHFSLPCSPLRFSPRAGELTSPPDRVGSRKALGSANKVQLNNATSCRSPHRLIATDERMSASSFGKVWSGTKARPFKWGRKLRSSRLLCVIFGALKRSLKCGRHGLPSIPSKRSLLDPDDPSSQEYSIQSHHDVVHSLKADHHLLRPL